MDEPNGQPEPGPDPTELEASMEYTDLNEKDNFLRYPTNKVVGMFSAPQELHAAILQLNKAGFGEDAIGVLCGEEGADRLDLTGKDHGPVARLYRFAEKAVDLEYKEFREYWGELQSGHFLIGVKAGDKDKRAQVFQILKSNGGHRINFFSRGYVQELAS